MTAEELVSFKKFLVDANKIDLSVLDANNQGPYLLLRGDKGTWIIKIEVKSE